MVEFEKKRDQKILSGEQNVVPSVRWLTEGGGSWPQIR